MSGSVLLVDDDDDLRTVLGEALGRRGFKTDTARDAAEALETLRKRDIDVVLADLQLGGTSGIELCTMVAEMRPDVPVIVVTAHGNLDVAVSAIRAGAYDFIQKPVNTDALTVALGRAVRHRQMTSEVKRLRDEVSGRKTASGIVGESPAIRRVLELVDTVAASEASVLVTGESGTGKELIARAIHLRSARAAKPFVAINCAAVPATLLESELFGHARGAFTDAKKARRGLFQQADGGTIFLDEIGEMPVEMQVKLLRVLQERTVRPVGEEEEVPFDARLVTATNRDLETEVEEGRFRADLFYRINVVHVPLPALRARQGDVLLLAQRFLSSHAERTGKPVAGLSAGAGQKLVAYDWPGNVRELENCMERAVALTKLSEITVEDLPERIREHASTRLIIEGDDPEEMLTLEEMERRYIRRVLAACKGNKSQTSRVLGMDRRSLYRRLETLGLEDDEKAG